jgi:hypothetical protein
MAPHQQPLLSQSALPARWRPVRADTLISLHFTPQGKISRHAHAGAWASLLWAPLWQNPLVDWLLRRFWAPASGALVAALAHFLHQLAARRRQRQLKQRAEGGAARPAAATPEAVAAGLLPTLSAVTGVAAAAGASGAVAAAQQQRAQVRGDGSQPGPAPVQGPAGSGEDDVGQKTKGQEATAEQGQPDASPAIAAGPAGKGPRRRRRGGTAVGHS